MISWVYGVTFCSFLYLKSLGDRSELIVVLPLIAMTCIALFDILIIKKTQIVYRIALLVPLLTIFLLEITMESFSYAIFITVLTLDTVAITIYGWDVLFVGPPRWLVMCNFLSFISYSATYLLLYSVLESGVESAYVLIPFGIMVLVEIYVIFILSSKGLDTVNKNRSDEMTRDRLIHSVAIIILFVVCIVHCYELISDTLNFALSTLLYFFGLVGYYVTRLYYKDGVKFRELNTINEFGISDSDEW